MTGSSQRQVRVLVVDDSAFIRRALIRMFEDHPLIRIVDVAADGAMALEAVKRTRPDVVTLDVRMPVMDGLEALRRIMEECPTPVVMLSSLTERGGENTIRALELGAVDFVDKSASGGAMDISSLRHELETKILVASHVDLLKLKETKETAPLARRSAPAGEHRTDLVLIGTSTGGPPALQAILSRLPAAFPCPILMVQHMPPGFTASLAARLDRLSPLRVKEAEQGETLQPGTAYLAMAGRHLMVRRRGEGYQALVQEERGKSLHCPSVDVLFTSAAEAAAERCLAYVLTGMGSDGVAGCRAIKEAGGRVYVEAEESAIVFGMPKAVMEAMPVDGVVPLSRCADNMVAVV
jgi:two-component system chemotaxis response regulator CheB